MSMKRNISRRKFLGEASCAALGSATFLSSGLNLAAMNTLAARPHIIGSDGDYKAMVCILLAGGADTFNFLVPTETSEYADYSATRGSLALDANNDLLNLNYNDNGRTFGVHDQLTGVQNMFDQGDLSFVANVGTLIEPIVDYNDFQNGNKKLPLGLYSHSDQIQQWQTSIPQTRSASGVAGRMADILQDMNSIPEISMNISLNGKNTFQSGNMYNEYSISNNASFDNIGYDGFPSWWSNYGHLNDVKNNTIDSLATMQYSNLFHKTIGALGKQTSESIEKFKVALGNVVPIENTFSGTNLSTDMKMIAELISVRSHLGAQRQVFYTVFGGWDHHDDVIGNQNAMLPVLNDALTEFNQSMKDIGMHDNVVTFTISDFARTLTSNGNGSDHAWGGNQMIMGGPITGGQIFGDYPSLSLSSGNNLNVSSRGRILPTTSVDEFYAELALWYGVSINDIDYILPNLSNFYSASGWPNSMPIGMFQ